MPFDSTPMGAEVQVATVGELLLEFFDGGKNWCANHYQMGNRRCLIAALDTVVRSDLPAREEATRLVHAAVVRRMLERGLYIDHPDKSCARADQEIAYFNDYVARGFGDIAAVCRDVK